MFMPYRNPAKLSLKRARLSCISCSCTKFCSRSAMASLNSANPSCSPSSALEEAALRERWALSRSELREDGRRGVVGRERGERERRRWEREDGGSRVGVVDDIGGCCVVRCEVQQPVCSVLWLSLCFGVSADDCGSTCLSAETVAWADTNVLVLCVVWEIKHGGGVVYEVRGQVPCRRGFDAKIDRKHDDAVFVCSSSSSLTLQSLGQSQNLSSSQLRPTER
jgi:hypothetical protein